MARFLDSNVPMYAVGSEHPLKQPSLLVMAHVARQPREFVTSVEVLQEIIHRYRAQRRWRQGGRSAFDYFAMLMRDRVEPVFEQDALLAAELADRYERPDSRDLFHVAVMLRLGVTEVISTDTGFDAIPEVTRIDPLAWATTMRTN